MKLKKKTVEFAKCRCENEDEQNNERRKIIIKK